MAKDMSPTIRTVKAGTTQSGLGNVFNGGRGQASSERSNRSHRAQEDVVAFHSWTPEAQVLQQGLTNVLRKRQLDLAASFSNYSDCPRLEAEPTHPNGLAS